MIKTETAKVLVHAGADAHLHVHDHEGKYGWLSLRIGEVSELVATNRNGDQAREFSVDGAFNFLSRLGYSRTLFVNFKKG